MVKVADQAAELAYNNGLKVSESIKLSLMPTPTVQDQRDGKVMRKVAIENLAKGKNRGIGLNALTESIGVDWNDGDTYTMTENGLVKDLLPTPAVGHIRNHDEPIEDYLERRQKFENGEYKGMPGVSFGVAIRMETEALLPTVTVQDAKNNGGPSQHNRNTLPLNTEVTLLGTPRTSSANGHSSNEIANGAPKARIEDQVMTTDWGKFEPAIRRWEAVLGRPAPAPTKPDGKDGSHRLSSEFTEWMMGVEPGWITGVGLKRNQELKACGNGVVPQQAELALSVLLEGLL